jgi:hypothetical protein
MGYVIADLILPQALFLLEVIGDWFSTSSDTPVSPARTMLTKMGGKTRGAWPWSPIATGRLPNAANLLNDARGDVIGLACQNRQTLGQQRPALIIVENWRRTP